MKLSLDEKTQTVTITLPIISFKSASGKSVVIASTRGNLKTDVLFDGKPITAGVNLYVAS